MRERLLTDIVAEAMVQTPEVPAKDVLRRVVANIALTGSSLNISEQANPMYFQATLELSVESARTLGWNGTIE